MTAKEAFTIIQAAGLRAELSSHGVVELVGDPAAVDATVPLVRIARNAIRAVLEEYKARCGNQDVAAQTLLRYGARPRTSPNHCGFFIGPQVTCVRCGASWREHHDLLKLDAPNRTK